MGRELPGVENDRRELFGMEKRWEGIVRGGEKMGREFPGVEKKWEGNCPARRKDGKGIARGGDRWRELSGVEKDMRGIVGKGDCLDTIGI